MKFLIGKVRREDVFAAGRRLIIAALALIICGHPVGTLAASYPSAISVRAILPENQIGSASYFDLLVQPGATQTVQIQISNADDKAVDASVELNPASSGLNGTIVYTASGNRDESAKYHIDEIANVREKTVRIPAKGTALVDIDINMPEENLNGVVLGGLRVTADYPDGEASSESKAPASGEQGMRIENKFAYVIGLKLSQNQDKVEPEFNLRSVTPRLVNYSSSVALNIGNTMPIIAKNMAVSAKIYHKGSDEVFREFSKDNAEMAPISNCDYIVDWGNRRIEPGTYRVLASVHYADKVWEWDEEFTVEAEAANSLNSGALGLDGAGGIPYWAYAIGSLLIILIALTIIILYRINSKRENA